VTRQLAALAPLLAVLTLTPGSYAATVTYEDSGATMVVQADVGDIDRLDIVRAQGDSRFQMRDASGQHPTGLSCAPFSTTDTFCPGSGVTKVRVLLEDQNDRVTFNDTPDHTLVSAEVDAGTGNDSVTGLSTLYSYDSDGGDGNDSLSGNGRNDTLDGGPGNDFLNPQTGDDVLIGGSGTDVVTYSRFTAVVAAIGTAGNGGPGENDTIGADVETLSGSVAGDTLTGNGDPNSLSGFGGPDELTGGGGPDILDGGEGDDILHSAGDGVADQVDCGPGNDTVDADELDQLAANCEFVPSVITSGPSGVVATSSATFEFATLDADPPSGRFECSLDAGSFTPCTSPLNLVGLSDAEHLFRVLYHPDGQGQGVSAERRWTVDTTAPVVSFDSAPSGGGNPPDATIAFSANEGNVAFSCSVDSAPVFDCSSPVVLHSLTPGLHTFEVDATDQAGNSSNAQRVEWEVVAPPPLAPGDFDCPVGRQKRIAFGVIVAIARSADGCFALERVGSAQALVSRGTVSVNGIRLSPGEGTRIVVDPDLVGGVVRATGPVTLSPGDLQLGWTLDGGFRFDGLAQGTVSALNRALENLEEELKLADLPIGGGLKFQFSADNGGQTTITPRIKLPRASFQALPGLSPEGTGLTVDVPITVSNDLGLTGGIRLKLDEANLFGKVKVKDLDLFYDHTTRTFEGSAGIELATGRVPASIPVGASKPLLTIAVALGPGGLIGPLKKLSFQTSKFNRHIGYGVFLQRFGAELSRADAPGGGALARWTSGGGLSLGPNVRIGALEIEALSLDATVTLDVPTGPQPPELFSVTAAGALKIVDVPVESATVRYLPPARVELAASLDYTLFGYGIAAELSKDAQGRPLSWVSPEGLNIEGRGQASLPGLGGTDPLDVVFSTSGWAACIGPDGDKVGFGRRWGGELNAMSDSCDVGPYRGGPAPASPSQAGARTTSIPAGARVAVLSARGQGAPPKVTVTGPRGERVETPAGPEGLRAKATLLFQDPQTNTTHVVLRNPAAGRWTVTPQPGSPALGAVRTADGLPPLRLRARVSAHGRGRKGDARRRTLSWQAGRLPFGQRLTFVERGSGTAHVLLTTRRRQGRLTFTPDPAPGRPRRIEVTVSRGGIPRLTRRVARFTAPRPVPLRRVAGLRLRGRTLTWTRRPGAASYALAIVSPDGASTSHSTTRPRLRLPFQPRRGRVAVRLLALDVDGKPGPQVAKRFRVPPRKPEPRR
jgi:hypothetical protein